MSGTEFDLQCGRNRPLWIAEAFRGYDVRSRRQAGESYMNRINQGVEHMKSLRGIRLHSSVCKVDDDLFERSRLARAGCLFIRLAVFVRAVEPALALVAVALLVTVPALAQTPGGNLFGGNDQQLGSGVREAIRWGRNLLFLLGVGGVGWGAANIMMEKAWGRQMLGGGICMGIGGILSLIYSFSQGNAVNLDTDLGN